MNKIRITNEIPFPNIDYINQLASEKNFSFGATYSEAPAILKDLYYIFEKEKESPDPANFDKRQHLLKKKIVEDKVMLRPLTNQETNEYYSSLAFIRDVDVQSVIGFSSLDRALNVIMFTTRLAVSATETAPVKQEHSVIEESDLKKAVEKFKDPEKKSAQAEKGPDHLSEDLTACIKEYYSGLSPEIISIYGAKNKLDMPVNKDIFRTIKVKAYMEDKLGLEESKEKRKVLDNRSKKKVFTNITEASDLATVSKSSMAMPDFKTKMAKKELIVKKKMSPKTAKQLYTMLLDDSGSMGCVQKQAYVRAVILNRLESVVKGHAELVFYFFESTRYGKRNIKTLQDAKDLFEEISTRLPRGGNTDIGGVLQATVDEIYNVPGYHDPELIIVNDGDDFVDPASIKSKGVKINVVSLGRENENLKQVAYESGGWFTAEKMYR